MFARSLLRTSLKAATPALKIKSPQIIATPFLRFQSTIPKPDIEKRVLDVFKSFLSDSTKLKPSSTFKDLDLDSLDAVELMVAVEEEFGIEIPDKESDEINSVKDAINYISAQSAAR